MAKYKVLQKFRNIETNDVYEANDEIELTVKRADEAIANLKQHKGEFLERLDDPADDDKKDEQEKPRKGK